MNTPETSHKTGLFIVFEGANGSGKSSAARAAADHFKEAGYDVVLTREPGGTPQAEKLREFLLDPTFSLDPHEQTLLFMVARRSHLRQVILPAVSRGAIVICDRYLASTLVYQTLRPEGGAPATIDEIRKAHKTWCWNTKPDLQILLDIDYKTANERRNMRFAEADRFESEDPDYEMQCINRYAESAQLLGFPGSTIDARQTQEEVSSNAISLIQSMIEARNISPA